MSSLALLLISNPSLKVIALCFCNLGPAGINILSNAILNRSNDTLQRLNLSNNNFGDMDLDQLVFALIKCKSCERLGWPAVESDLGDVLRSQGYWEIKSQTSDIWSSIEIPSITTVLLPWQIPCQTTTNFEYWLWAHPCLETMSSPIKAGWPCWNLFVTARASKIWCSPIILLRV